MSWENRLDRIPVNTHLRDKSIVLGFENVIYDARPGQYGGMSTHWWLRSLALYGLMLTANSLYLTDWEEPHLDRDLNPPCKHCTAAVVARAEWELLSKENEVKQ